MIHKLILNTTKLKLTVVFGECETERAKLDSQSDMRITRLTN